MNIIDIIIILIILLGIVDGFRRGFTYKLISFLGVILIIVLAFLFKNPLSKLFYMHLPFFKFGGLLKGITVLNILVYEIIAFIIVAVILGVIFKILLMFSKIFEKILKVTIIFGIPSKILGAIIGAIQAFLIVFVILYFLSMPIFTIDEVNESVLRNKILNNTPIFGDVISDSLTVINKFTKLKDEYKDDTISTNEFNLNALDLFLEYNIIDIDSVDELISKDKLNIQNIDTVLEKYR